MSSEAWPAALLGACYLLSCSCLLIANKLVVQSIPAPALVHVAQFGFAAATVALLHCSGAADVDGFTWRKVKPNIAMAVISSSAMYFNMAALRVSDVSTILVARAACPIVDCIIEHLFLGRVLPSGKGCLMLLIVALSAAGYMWSLGEHHHEVGAETLLLCYFVFICLSDTFGKWIVSGLDWENKQWGPVLYSNVLAMPYQAAIAAATHEPAVLVTLTWSPMTVALLLFTCIVGTSLSFFGWA